MRNAQDVESFLIRMGQPYEDLGNGLFVVKDETRPGDVAIKVEDPIVVFRTKVMELPVARREELYRMLLDMNAREMVHGAYGIEDDAIVMNAAMPLENLDYNEVMAVLDEFALAMSKHLPRLRGFHAAS